MTDTNRSGRAQAWGTVLVLGGLFAACVHGPSEAARISNPVASFSGLDKITGRITSFDVYVGETVQFGALQVTPRACYTSDADEAQKVDTFVEVDEITLDRKIRRIFNGWMFADSPALNAVEHPIFDVWLKECKAKSDMPPPAGLKIPPNVATKPAAPQAGAAPAPDAAPAGPLPADPSFNQPLDPDNQEALPPIDPQAPQGDVFGRPGVPQDQQQQDFGAPPQDQPDDGFGDPGFQDGGQDPGFGGGNGGNNGQNDGSGGGFQ